jgi:hypothetical protein
MADDRINRLSERFRRHEVTPSPPQIPSRGRRSFYVDLTLVARLDETYRVLRHDLYPLELTKSEFLEALLEFGIEHLSHVTERLVDQADRRDTDAPHNH